MDTGTPASCPVFAVEVGSGWSQHSPLTSGDSLPIMEGAGGGWFADVSVAVTGSGEVIVLDAELYWPRGAMELDPDEGGITVGLLGYDEETCTGSLWGQQVFIWPEDPGMPRSDFVCSLMGEELDLTLQVTDLDTEAAVSATVRVIAVAGSSLECG